ncbi:MAG TPA: tRNA 2-thiouridine(34) synthase MnmA [Candidatus Hydrogenedentes bacterium]|nr:tRNA 2-thiouridine(34) synthase MnmA [Candidatus Hydrogenedentota bacterium]HPG65607.1 tRNA 2-thiouridine(34) synthase MnmA [Candidatus Hydrogenedentota bacterium]
MSSLRKPKLLVAISGGVDSAVAAALLVDAGFDVVAGTMVVSEGPESSETLGAATAVARQLGLPFHAFHIESDFERLVINEFLEEYRRGRTPNPCIRCNIAVKFGILVDAARRLGAEGLATGHYARLDVRGGRRVLRRAAHGEKDQSYFLAGLDQEQLGSARFPLGDLTKAEVRARAAELGLEAAGRAESQEVCFVADDDYGRFVATRTGACEPGPIFSMAGEILGQHHGLIHYTVGQRRGLGIAAPRPYYVVRVDAARNALVVGGEADTYCQRLWARSVNWCSIARPEGPIRSLAQIRYRHKATPALVVPQGEGIEVVFDVPLRSVAPGQWVVLYDEAGYALAAGAIDAFESACKG